MDPTAFTGFAIFIIMAVVTGVIGYLAIQQGKLKRQIEESRRQREREELASLSGVDPTALPGVVPPLITPGATTPGPTSGDAPRIEPGGTPHHPHSPHDGGGFDGGVGGAGGHQ